MGYSSRDIDRNFRKEVINHIYDVIDYYKDTIGAELHHQFFNMNYWIIGTYEAKQMLGKNRHF
jgi:hypothetical protein